MASVPLQGTWTNSWTCWTSGMLVEKDQSLDLDLEPTLTMTSNTLPRLIQKQGGQFDTDMDAMTMEYGHEKNFNYMDKESISFEDMDLPDMLNLPMPADAAMSEDDFLNSFMDLSEFLLPVHPAEETEEVPNVISLEEDLNNLPSWIEPVPQEAVVCEEVAPQEVFVKRENDDIDSDWSLNNDHDYVTKKPRLSPTPCVADTTKKSKSTQSASKPAVQKTTPDQKYRERRIKNNIASRRSREIRKMKFSEMDEEANRLEVVNAELRVRIEEMEKVAKEMKALLVQKLAAK